MELELRVVRPMWQTGDVRTRRETLRPLSHGVKVSRMADGSVGSTLLKTLRGHGDQFIPSQRVASMLRWPSLARWSRQ